MSDFPTHFGVYLDGCYDAPVQYWSGALPAISDAPEISPVSAVFSGFAPIRNWRIRPYFCDSLASVCETALGGVIADITFPGGEERGACHVLWADGRTAIATVRTDSGRALLEERVMRHLYQQAAKVPNVLFYNGIVLIQEVLEGVGLARGLASATSQQCGEWLAEGFRSLVTIHHAASREGLDRAVPFLGTSEAWIMRHIRQVHKTGDALALPAPSLPKQALHDILLPMNPRFVKWDARPGNAMLSTTGQVSWFDWENCGARNRLDDLVWLLCDESVPFHAEIEQALLEEFVPLFADGASIAAAHRYVCIAGALHCSARLSLILHKKADGPWWDIEEILLYDYIGVTLTQAQRLCLRGAFLAQCEPLIASLVPWFLDLNQKLETL
ncbi:MAG TPA: phosphotransferase [Candidatus Thiothrix moscowensis]|uniref:phosphotransferase n=1 Tax=unclassified Thiothrix TaxID=2636184 RepID=UPI0025F52D8E|nr:MULTISPECIES: phosphotransferase [unclassified Thiothrix]HRJ51780.1 phosphotransferase [Candidatus Thiothrix moscowensis]HRJ92095.1 phosphotransferase [Candidatus Thiothrix moscowensis]